MYHAGNQWKIQSTKITLKTHFGIVVSIVAQTKKNVQQIGVILIKSNSHDIRVIVLP